MFQNLQAEMARKNLTGREIARTLMISEQTFYNKTHGLREWKLSEMEQVKAMLGTSEPLEYLFKR